MKTKGSILRSLVVGAFFVPSIVSAAIPEPVLATDGVVYERSDIVVGFDTYKDPFHIQNAGVYEAKLTDFGFPNNFDYIGLMLTQGSTKLGVIEGSGSFTFDAEPGTYNAFFVGSIGDALLPDSSASLVGSYDIRVAMVPELETWLMMGIGFLAIAYWVRRQNGRRSDIALHAQPA